MATHVIFEIDGQDVTFEVTERTRSGEAFTAGTGDSISRAAQPFQGNVSEIHQAKLSL